MERLCGASGVFVSLPVQRCGQLHHRHLPRGRCRISLVRTHRYISQCDSGGASLARKDRRPRPRVNHFLDGIRTARCDLAHHRNVGIRSAEPSMSQEGQAPYAIAGFACGTTPSTVRRSGQRQRRPARIVPARARPVPVSGTTIEQLSDLGDVCVVERRTDFASSLEVTGHAERQSHVMLSLTIVNLDRAMGPHQLLRDRVVPGAQRWRVLRAGANRARGIRRESRWPSGWFRCSTA